MIGSLHFHRVAAHDTKVVVLVNETRRISCGACYQEFVRAAIARAILLRLRWTDQLNQERLTGWGVDGVDDAEKGRQREDMPELHQAGEHVKISDMSGPAKNSR
jgi:hypothetical protein